MAGNDALTPPESDPVEERVRLGDGPIEDHAEKNCIVVADDEPAFHRIVRRSLAKPMPEITISAGENGQEALIEIDRILSDLHSRLVGVVSDQMMPVMKGWELYEALRSRDGGKDVPFIMMSGGMPNDLKEKVAEIKKIDPLFRLLAKPFTPDQLVEVIHELISLRASLKGAAEVQ